MPRLYNKRTDKIPKDAVLIDRTTIYGNPFPINSKQNRTEVLLKYKEYLKQKLISNPKFLESLRGFNLICWCSPQPCHGDIIFEFLYGNLKIEYNNREE